MGKEKTLSLIRELFTEKPKGALNGNVIIPDEQDLSVDHLTTAKLYQKFVKGKDNVWLVTDRWADDRLEGIRYLTKDGEIYEYYDESGLCVQEIDFHDKPVDLPCKTIWENGVIVEKWFVPIDNDELFFEYFKKHGIFLVREFFGSDGKLSEEAYCVNASEDGWYCLATRRIGKNGTVCEVDGGLVDEKFFKNMVFNSRTRRDSNSQPTD